MPGFSPKMAVVLPSPSSPISPSSSVGGSSNNNSESSNNRQRTIDLRHPNYGIVIGVAIASVVVIAFIAFSFIRDRRKKKQKRHSTNFVAPPANISVTLDVTKGHPTQNECALSNSQHSWDSRKGQNHNSPDSGIISPSKTSFSYEEMMEMTNGFAQQNVIGEATLKRHLHDTGLSVLEWAKRVKIAIGAAKGLAYLHEDCHPKIIHRDIKSANILLDEYFEAQAIQVADFGLARLIGTSQTHVSTRVMGTFGYLAPEYASSGKLTDRSDVYSFGVVLLELITGRKPVDPTRPLGDESLVEWARPLLIQALETGNFGELIDPRLEKRYVEIELFRMIEAAAACVRHSAAKRPRMALVVRALDFDGDPDLSNGIKFGQSTAYDSGQYSEKITKFRRMEFCSDNSSDYDMYGDDHISGESSGAQLSSWKSWYSSSESQAQASKPSSSGSYSDGSRNYGSGRFR
ncbi:hypothetical protein J1N35_029152 [Gossypium stocksii]|uniref:non-specific serine/threonine protein kinase n=1 Tax=Gossypium stocksii TaxID=47602 RepID=A0A9D3ZT97_9ROSI|nr:hypothetical protein J1N35_029152 [Gossypium stocksii]